MMLPDPTLAPPTAITNVVEAQLGWRAAYRNPEVHGGVSYMPVLFWGNCGPERVALVVGYESDMLTRASDFAHPALGDFICLLAPGESEEEVNDTAERLADEEGADDIKQTNRRIVVVIKDRYDVTVSEREAELALEFFGSYVDGLTTMPLTILVGWLNAYRWLHRTGGLVEGK